MATTDQPRQQAGGSHATLAPMLPAEVNAPAKGAAAYMWAIARLSLGWIFLWAFLDKLFGLGHETPSARAWIDGGSPTGAS